ncbi:MAG TPA: hypothetical protein DIS94_10040 [Bacteroidetes bacterium]|nr:hypothetical protein [Bacteroidota bacterium]
MTFTQLGYYFKTYNGVHMKTPPKIATIRITKFRSLEKARRRFIFPFKKMTIIEAIKINKPLSKV